MEILRVPDDPLSGILRIREQELTDLSQSLYQ
jgi:hypothetical protein